MSTENTEETTKQHDVQEKQISGEAAGAAESFRDEMISNKDDSLNLLRKANESTQSTLGLNLPSIELNTSAQGGESVSKAGADQSAEKSADKTTGKAADKSNETKEPYQIAKDLADAVKNGKPLDQTQKDIEQYIQKMMNDGLSDFEIRKWVGRLSEELSGKNTGLTNADGSPKDLAVRLSGPNDGGYKVHILQNEMTNNEKELSKFEVKDTGVQPPEKGENKEPWQIAKDLVNAIKDGKPLDGVQKDIAKYLEKLMASGMSEFEIRKHMGQLSNDLTSRYTAAVDGNGRQLDLAIMLSGDGSNGFRVHILQDALTKREKELSTFEVPRKK